MNWTYSKSKEKNLHKLVVHPKQAALLDSTVQAARYFLIFLRKYLCIFQCYNSSHRRLKMSIQKKKQSEGSFSVTRVTLYWMKKKKRNEAMICQCFLIFSKKISLNWKHKRYNLLEQTKMNSCKSIFWKSISLILVYMYWKANF